MQSRLRVAQTLLGIMQTHLGGLQSIARRRAVASRSRTVAARLRALATPGGTVGAAEAIRQRNSGWQVLKIAKAVVARLT
jgi:hypothetical protein